MPRAWICAELRSGGLVRLVGRRAADRDMGSRVEPFGRQLAAADLERLLGPFDWCIG